MLSATALSKRLSNHCRHLVTRIIANRFRSVEIVLAFMVNVPRMFPGKRSADDETMLVRIDGCDHGHRSIIAQDRHAARIITGSQIGPLLPGGLHRPQICPIPGRIRGPGSKF